MNGPLPAARWGPLVAKEFRETFRDSRTIVTLVVMPLLLYPLLGILLRQFAVATLLDGDDPRKPKFAIATSSQEEAVRFRLLAGFPTPTPERNESRRETAADPTLPADTEPDDVDVQLLFPERPGVEIDLAAFVADGTADAAFSLVPGGPGEPVAITILERRGSTASRAARLFLERKIREANLKRLGDELARVRGKPTVLPVAATTEKVDSSTRPSSLIASVIPLVLVLMTITGAVYPAIDLTAGERERGTLEALVATPVPTWRVVLAKYAAVVSVAVMTAIVNLLASAATLTATGLAGPLLEGSSPLTLIGGTLALLTVFAMFFAAVLLCVTGRAQSFKEAQAYLIPVVLTALVPAVVSLFPEATLYGPLLFVPLANVVLLTRSVLDGSADLPTAYIVLLTTLMLTVVALRYAVGIFGRDAVDQRQTGWADMAASLKNLGPSPVTATALLAVVFVAYAVASGGLAGAAGAGITARLMIGVVITGLVFGWLPFVLARALKWDLRETFRLRSAGPMAFIGAAFLGLSLWAFAFEFLVSVISEEQKAKFAELFGGFEGALAAVPLPVKLLCLAVTPAVCEELFFRGPILTGFRRGFGATAAVVVTAVAFGLFHVVVRGDVFWGRFPATFFLGLFLGGVAVRTGSIWPGILLHVLNNALLLTIAHFKTDLIAAGVLTEKSEHLPGSLLITAGVVAALGTGLIGISKKPAVSQREPEA